MATYDTEPLPAPLPLGPTGETCRECGALLVPDQRFCLSCGLARADARVELESLYAPVAPPPQPAPPPPSGPPRGWFGVTPQGLVLGVAATACAFIVGLVVGLVVNADDPPPVAEQAPPVVNVEAPAPVAAPAATVTPEPTPDPAAEAEAEQPPKEDPTAETLDDQALEEQQNADPETFQKNSKKLDKAQTEGAPPPTDDEPAGGGDQGETFE